MGHAVAYVAHTDSVNQGCDHASRLGDEQLGAASHVQVGQRRARLSPSAYNETNAFHTTADEGS